MIRKYWWLVVFVLSLLVLDGVIMKSVEYLATDATQCRNMNSVNPLKLVDCDNL
ncbi:DUF2556 family protein [Salmonella enterica]